MPRVKFIAVPEWQKAKEADLRERYGRGVTTPQSALPTAPLTRGAVKGKE